jgi:5'-nucleotidase
MITGRAHPMRMLLTNDDGISAPGLAALAWAASQLGEAITLAPAAPCSSCSHQVTTHRPIVTRCVEPGRIAVEGWPVDCVRVALRGMGLDVDWVLAGINAGGNLGADVYESGTVAAIREATLLGRPAIALSHYRQREKDFDWQRAGRWALALLPDLLARPVVPGTFWNVNLPNLDPAAQDPEVVFCPLDSQPMPVQFRQEGEHFLYQGDYHRRPRDPGADVDVCFGGRISVSLLRLG